jgi:hypothetical protein
MRRRHLFTLHPGYRCEEAKANPWDGFHKDGILGWVTERLTKPVEHCLDVGIEIDERIRWPQAGPKLIAQDDLSCIFEEYQQKLE